MGTQVKEIYSQIGRLALQLKLYNGVIYGPLVFHFSFGVLY